MFEQYDDHAFEVIYVAFTNLTEASRVAQKVVEENLAACVNVIPGVMSFYKDNGTLQKKPEALLIAKTRAEIRPMLQEYIVANHPYDTPGLVVLSIEDGHAPYLEWMVEQTMQNQGKEAN